MKRDINDVLRAEGDEGVKARLAVAAVKPYNGKAPELSAGEPELIIRRASVIKPEPITWIWKDRVARGKQTAVAGEPGLGKSQFGVFFTATVTVGGSWPDGGGEAPVGRVIILSAEDDAADTIVPRLMAAGADLDLVEILHAVKRQDGRKARSCFNLQTDLDMLERAIKEFGDVQAVLIDPVSAYLGKGIDSHKDVEVRGVMAPVTEMAGHLGVGILTISHFNKSSGPGNAKALHKFMGSIAFVAGPRVAFAVMEDAEDPERRLLLHAKNNIAAPACGLAFRVRQKHLEEVNISASHIVWEADPVSITADEAVAAGNSAVKAPALEEAKKFLTEIIKPGGTKLEAIEKEVKAARLAWATVRRARDELGIKSVRAGFAPEDGWMWKR